MAEVATKVEKMDDEEVIKASPFKHPIHITRNGVTMELTPFAGSRGKWLNQAYAAPQIEENPDLDFDNDKTFIQGLKFVGKSNLAMMVNLIAKRSGQDYTEDSIPHDSDGNVTGAFNPETFKGFWEQWTAAGQRMSELAEQIEGEQKRFLQFVSVDLMNAINGGDAEAVKKAQEEVARRKRRIETLRGQLETRKARYSKEAATDETRPE